MGTLYRNTKDGHLYTLGRQYLRCGCSQVWSTRYLMSGLSHKEKVRKVSESQNETEWNLSDFVPVSEGAL